jgi:UPF0755 protein
MGKRRLIRIKSRKRFVVFVAIILVLIILACSLIFMSYIKKGNEALNPDDSTVISVTVPNGTSTQGIGNLLESNGLIASADFFKLQSRLNGFDGKFKAGEYILSPSMTWVRSWKS